MCHVMCCCKILAEVRKKFTYLSLQAKISLPVTLTFNFLYTHLDNVMHVLHVYFSVTNVYSERRNIHIIGRR